MERLRTKDLTTLNNFIRMLYSFDDTTTLSEHIVKHLPALISADIYSYDEIDTRSQRALLKWAPSDVAMIPDGFAILARHADENPIVPYFKATGDGRARMVSDFLRQRQFRSRPLYQEFYKPYSIPFHLITALSITGETTITLSYHRGGKEFTERDRQILNLTRPHIMQAFQNARRTSALQEEARTKHYALESLSIPLLYASPDGRIQWITSSGQRLLRQYGLSLRGSRLPSVILRWAQRLDAQMALPNNLPDPCVPLEIPGVSGTLRVQPLRSHSIWLFFFEETKQRMPIKYFAQLGLTPRETEIFWWVAQGKSNPEIATILSISVRTIHKHVEHIYLKLEVENRHAAISLAFEAMRSPLC